MEQQVKELVEKNRDLVEIGILGGPILLQLFVALFCGSKGWLKLERLTSLSVASICLFCPKWAFKLATNNIEITDYHLFFIALIGVYDANSILGAFFLRKSKDESIYYGHFWSKLIVIQLLFFIFFEFFFS
jgi:hypothetical protein